MQVGVVSAARITLALALLVSHSSLFAQPALDAVSDGVGATMGEFRVDEGGNASYAIPIFAPPGTAGVAPKIALAYNSQGGIGPIGKGWSIRGASAISRCRKGREYGDFIIDGVPVDGNPVAIAFNNQDAFCLDGQRLIATSGIYGSDGAEYRLETDPFTKVASIGGNNGTSSYSGPTSFVVWRKDGSRSEYGSSLDSRIERSPCASNVTTCNALVAAAWALTRFEDSTGNYIQYAYTESGFSYFARYADYQLASVSYTGKRTLPGQSGPALAPYAAIYFNYEAIPSATVLANGEETQLGYEGGTAFTQTQVLRSIEVKDQIDTANSRTLRFYRLCYGTVNCNQGDKISTSGSRFRMLRSVVECRTNPVPGGIADPNAVCYRPTVFRWSDEDGVAHRFDGPDLDAGSGNNARVGGARLGDIDGDGRTDVVWFRRDDPACPSGNRLRVGYGDRVEVGGQSKATLVTPDIATFCTSLNAGNGELNTGFGLLDFDGDGRDDLAIADNNGIAGAKWHIYRSLGRPTVSSGNAFDTSTDLMNVAISTADDSQDQAQFGDFNGDGLLDILYPTGSNGLAIRYLQRNATQTAFEFGAEYALNFTLADCSGFSCNLEIFNQPTAGFGVASDFSGDGRSDLVLRVIRSNSAVPGQTTVTYISGENLAIQRPDLALAFESQRFHAVALGARDDVGRIQVASQYGNTLHVRNDIGVQDPRDFQFADLNGDGLADLFYYYPIQGDDDYRFALNRGNGFDGPNGSVVTGAVQNIPNKEKLRLADVNGDGRADVLYPSGDSAPCAGTIAADHAYRSRSWSMRFGATTNGRIDDPDQGANPQNGATCLAGNGAKAGSLTDSEYYFADFDGDGATDFLRLRDRIGTVSVGGVTQSDPEIALSRANAASRFKARDAIVRITNGNGAVTNITYQPLTNKAIYRRATNSRNLKIWGGGFNSEVHRVAGFRAVLRSAF